VVFPKLQWELLGQVTIHITHDYSVGNTRFRFVASTLPADIKCHSNLTQRIPTIDPQQKSKAPRNRSKLISIDEFIGNQHVPQLPRKTCKRSRTPRRARNTQPKQVRSVVIVQAVPTPDLPAPPDVPIGATVEPTLVPEDSPERLGPQDLEEWLDFPAVHTNFPEDYEPTTVINNSNNNSCPVEFIEQLHRAVREGKYWTLYMLLSEPYADVNACNADGDTPLMLAAHYGHAKIVKLLIERGALLDEKNRNGITAADYALANGNLMIAVMLVEAGVQEPPTKKPRNERPQPNEEVEEVFTEFYEEQEGPLVPL